MSKQEQQKVIGEESLAPNHHRVMDNISYTLAWIGGSVFIGYFMLGASLVPPVGKLNMVQAMACISLAALIVSVCFNINGQAGHKYGIPFVVQSRQSFGFKGSKITCAVRAIPAIFWFGIQSWVGALAINGILIKTIGFDSPMICFIGFQILQIVLASLGFKGIKWVENVGGIVIVVSLGYMLFIINKVYGAQIQSNLIDFKGTWGMAFWGGTTAFLGVFTTLMLNIGDYTREYSKKSSNKMMFIIHLIGTLPTTLFMALIGLMAAGVTGEWDPIKLFVELMPNSFMLFMSLFFVAVAQITTNVMLNVIPPAYVIMDIFKVSYKKGAVITGILAFFTFPWMIANSSGFFLFIQVYSIFLGPIFAVMVVDYYMLRGKRLSERDIEELYDENGPYKGINWAGLIAVAVGAAFGTLEVQISWYISLIPAGLTYYALMKHSAFSKSSFAPKGIEAERSKAV
ncbi:allantoin permease PucI [Peptoclostridium acidaminophilum DSM 3953]|uniref:Allantoin permease PucI n=1 Tax=Peptoclostridium acidaminophilum DSM 3953 TaxID=1286171 RepID=W8THA8_PEPAC|nr:NCS1 family transporter [Peptoclostridium acidaminophilum]AHM57198.1 allantoin permease PucI [Peptoclostridium acidaminophilum DSM 3953]